MKSLIIVMLLALTAKAQAHTEVITCHFTEPFYVLEVNLKEKTFSKSFPDWENENGGSKLVVLNKDVQLVSTSTDPLFSTFDLRTATGETIMALTMDFQGSDGMSDFAYPLSAVHNGFYGGCETDKLFAQDINY